MDFGNHDKKRKSGRESESIGVQIQITSTKGHKMIESTETKIPYSTNGSQITFPVPFPFDDPSHIEVWIRNNATKLHDKLINPGDYTVPPQAGQSETSRREPPDSSTLPVMPSRPGRDSPPVLSFQPAMKNRMARPPCSSWRGPRAISCSAGVSVRASAGKLKPDPGNPHDVDLKACIMLPAASRRRDRAAGI
jgi:hypothetical protein